MQKNPNFSSVYFCFSETSAQKALIKDDWTTSSSSAWEMFILSNVKKKEIRSLAIGSDWLVNP